MGDPQGVPDKAALVREDWMAGGKIYLREKDGLVPMTEAGYDAEDLLQKLLAD